MDNYILNLIVNVALMAFAIFSVLELIYDRSIKGSLFCKIKQRGWLLIFFAVLSVGFNLYKDWKSDCKQYSSEKEKAKVDSMLQVSQSKLLQIQISAKDSIIKEVKNTYTNSLL